MLSPTNGFLFISFRLIIAFFKYFQNLIIIIFCEGQAHVVIIFSFFELYMLPIFTHHCSLVCFQVVTPSSQQTFDLICPNKILFRTMLPFDHCAHVISLFLFILTRWCLPSFTVLGWFHFFLHCRVFTSFSTQNLHLCCLQFLLVF